MSDDTKTDSSSFAKMWPVYLAVAFLVFFGAIFLFEFFELSQGMDGAEVLTADTYMDVVEPLLTNANPDNGPELLQIHGCNACHAGDNAGRLAPGHVGLNEIAAERRPPLTAAAYIYEAIIYPGAYTVEGFQNNMPRLYDEQIPQDQLGDIIAYLLLPQDE